MSCWFRLPWTRADRREEVQYSRVGAKDSIKLIDESLPDPDADEKPYPFIPLLIDDEEVIEIYNTKKKLKKVRVSLSQKERIIVLDIKGRRCNKCGNQTTLEIHHIDENPSNNNLDNLEVLCHECHKYIKKRAHT